MKVAVVTDDGKTISQHFGRARFYRVYEIRDGAVVGSEQRPKAGHHVEGVSHHEHEAGPHGHHHGDEATHNNMLAARAAWGGGHTMQSRGRGSSPS